jgi:hypothetical protein
MDQLKNLSLMLSNILLGENTTYKFMVLLVIFITAISIMVAFFKFLFLAKEHYYSSKFLKIFSNLNDLQNIFENAELLKSKSILATAYFYGFKEFYSIYKLNPHYQSGSTIALSTRTMEIAISRKIAQANGYSFMLYLSFLLPGLAMCAIIFNYSNYIEIYKSFDKIDPTILVDSLRLFFLAVASSLIISSLFIFIDKYLETRMLKFKKFVDEYTLIIHKRFYSKEYDIEN